MSDAPAPKAPNPSNVNNVKLSQSFVKECVGRCDGVAAFERNGVYVLAFSGVDAERGAALDAFIRDRSAGAEVKRQCEGDAVNYSMQKSTFEKCAGAAQRAMGSS